MKTSECPVCGCTETKVVDSRVRDNGYIARRRECMNCGRRWSTFEVPGTELSVANMIIDPQTEDLYSFNAYELYGLVGSLCPMDSTCVENIISYITMSYSTILKNQGKQTLSSNAVNEIIASTLLFFNMEAFVVYCLRHVLIPGRSIFEFSQLVVDYANKCKDSFTYDLIRDNATVPQKQTADRILGIIVQRRAPKQED